MLSDSKEDKRILVVEDDDATREAVSMVLRDEGYDVTAAANGREALQRLRHSHLPNLILLDLMMPIMNGWEFRQEQQQDPALHDIPVVVVSADACVPQQAAAIGVRDVIVKPVDLDQLLDAVHRYC